MKNIAADTPVRQIFDVYRGAVLPILLKDKTTGKNILWATDEYDAISPKSEIEFKDITGGSLMLVRPRIAKTLDAQRDRTKKRAEVFTPSWICNQMNNALDDDYLGYTGAFNTEGDKAWTRNRKKIQFNDGRTWQEYVDQTRLEITCGEAPFVTSRYNPTDGIFIEVKDRIGFLDRKLRVVEENADGDEYKKWSMRSLESCYGYEYQGDNLLIARINVFLSWTEHWEKKLGEKPDRTTARSAANVIAWNFWQMDGLTGRTPQIKEKECGQMTLPGFEVENESSKSDATEECLIYDWRRRKKSLCKPSSDLQFFYNKGELAMKKFFAVIGNPPYQETVAKVDTKNGQKRVSSIFQDFQTEVDKIAENSELIYPAKRWIHRSGKGMAQFGLANINDPHLSKLVVYPNAKDVFPNNADISDGISIVLKQQSHTGNTFKYINIENKESIETELEYPGESLLPINPRDLAITNKIKKFCQKNNLPYLADSILSQKLFGIESDFVEKNPRKVRLYNGNDIFDKEKEIKLLTNDKAGKSGRARWYIANRNVIESGREYIDKWKVVVSSANAGGQKRSSQISLMDNYSAFGRSRVALKTFKTKKEAEFFKRYCVSCLIKFAFLLTDEALTSLAKLVPDIQDYTQKNQFIDFDDDIDNQLFKIFDLTDAEKKYVIERAKEYKE